MQQMLDEKATTALMWIFTVLLFLGILVIILPLIDSCFNTKLNVISIGQPTTVTMGRTTALTGIAMTIVGFFGAMLVGVSTAKGKETFKRMYM